MFRWYACTKVDTTGGVLKTSQRLATLYYHLHTLAAYLTAGWVQQKTLLYHLTFFTALLLLLCSPAPTPC